MTVNPDERQIGVVMNEPGLAVMLDFFMALAAAVESEPAIEGWQFIDDSAHLARLIANEVSSDSRASRSVRGARRCRANDPCPIRR